MPLDQLGSIILKESADLPFRHHERGHREAEDHVKFCLVKTPVPPLICQGKLRDENLDKMPKSNSRSETQRELRGHEPKHKLTPKPPTKK